MFFDSQLLTSEDLYNGMDGAGRYLRDLFLELIKISEVQAFIAAAIFDTIVAIVLRKLGLRAKTIGFIIGLIGFIELVLGAAIQ